MTTRRRVAPIAMILGILVLTALGVWQVHRLAWKEALIARVDRAVMATPVPAPGPHQWQTIGPDNAYTRITARGHWLPVRPLFATASTAIGYGYWMIQPMRDDRGFTLLVNRGYVPADDRDVIAPVTGPAAVTGLLRVTEPGGGFLRANRPAQDRWYARDVAAMARARGLTGIAPYFIDEGAHGAGWPRGGMTVIHFYNHHLLYAVTWFTMAAMLAGAGLWQWRARHRGRSAA